MAHAAALRDSSAGHRSYWTDEHVAALRRGVDKCALITHTPPPPPPPPPSNCAAPVSHVEKRLSQLCRRCDIPWQACMSRPAHAVLLDVGLQMAGLKQGRLCALCMCRHGKGEWKKIKYDDDFKVLAHKSAQCLGVRHTHL